MKSLNAKYREACALSNPDTRPALFWAVLLCLSTAAWSFHLTSFLHAKDLVLALGLPVILVMQYRRFQVTLRGFRALWPLWAGVVFWGISGLFIAEVPAHLLESLVRWALVLLVAQFMLEAFLAPGQREWLYRAFIASGLAVSALGVLQYAGLLHWMLPVFPGYDQRAYSVFGNQNLLGGYTAFTLVLLVALFARSRKPDAPQLLGFSAAVALLLGALVISATRTAWLAAAVGTVSMLFMPGGFTRISRLLRRSPRPFLLLPAVAVAIVLVMGAPLLQHRISQTLSEADVGGRGRLWFWTGALHMIRDHPWTGTGLGQFAYWSPLYQGKALWEPGGETHFFNELHTVHAHSEPLEWLAETGALGILFWAAFFLVTFRRRNPGLPALITLGVFGCFNTFTHSAPHALALLLLAGSARKMTGPSRPIPKVTALLAGAAVPVVFLLVVIVPSVLLCRAEQAHVRGDDPKALYQRALAWPWPNYRAHENYAIALLDADRFLEARHHLETATAGADTGRIYLLMTICAVAQREDYLAFVYARECLLRWPRNEYAWSTLMERCPPEQAAFWREAQRRFTGVTE